MDKQTNKTVASTQGFHDNYLHWRLAGWMGLSKQLEGRLTKMADVVLQTLHAGGGEGRGG